MKIKEIIVVEGRDDTNRVKEAVDCDTFETNGSALTKKKIERLIYLEKTRGIIVLTDPDYAGKRIRNIIEKNIPTAKHAYISNKKAVDSKGKIGIEAALREELCERLNIGYTNAKQLLNKLNMYNISRERLLDEMNKINKGHKR